MKGKIKSSALAGICALLFVCSSGSLTEIAKPYLGSYECTEAKLGATDLLGEFKEIRLELLDGENYQIVYLEKGQERKKVGGKYAFNQEKGVLTLVDKGGFNREFPFTDGKLTVSFPVGNRQAVIVFERK